MHIERSEVNELVSAIDKGEKGQQPKRTHSRNTYFSDVFSKYLYLMSESALRTTIEVEGIQDGKLYNFLLAFTLKFQQ